MLELEVISLHGALLSAPSLVTPEFRELLRLVRASRVTLPTGDGGVVHLFVVCGIKGRRRTPRSYRSLIGYLMLCLLRPRLCVGQPLLSVVDVNADPGDIPCLAVGKSAGRFVDLALADWMRALGPRGTLLLLVLVRWLLPLLAGLPMGGSLLMSLLLLSFVLAVGRLRFLVLGPPSWFGRPAGWTFLTGLLPLSLKCSGASGTLKGRRWAPSFLTLFRLSGRPLIGIVWMSSGIAGVLVLRLIFFGLTSGPGFLSLLACRPFLGRVSCRSGGGDLGEELLEEVVPVSCTELVTLMMLISRRQLFSCSCAAPLASDQVSGGRLYESRGLAGLRALWNLGFIGSSRDLHGFYNRDLDYLGLLNEFVRQVVTSRRAYFCWSGHPVVTVDQFLHFVRPFFSSGERDGFA